MFPEPTPPARPIESRSLAPAWSCSRCGQINTPINAGFFLLPRFRCVRCLCRVKINFNFCFVTLKVHGFQIMPRVRNQEFYPTCTIHSALAVMEILLRLQAARSHQGFDLTLSWRDVFTKYQLRMNCIFNNDSQGDKCWGRLFNMLNILRDIGVIDELHGRVHKIKGWTWLPNMTFIKACEMIASGIPLLTIIPYMPHMIELKENDVYSTKGYPSKDIIENHVVVLIGGIEEFDNEMFWFLDSHGEKSQVKGIAKVFYEECLLGFGTIDL